MKLAVVAPVIHPILATPKYGGIERIIKSLVLACCQAGHAVTLYAPAGTDITHRNLTLQPTTTNAPATPLAIRQAEIELFRRVAADAGKFDIIHSHIEPIIAQEGNRNFFADLPAPLVVTMHNQTYIDQHIRYYQAAQSLWPITYVFISHNQSQPLSFLPNQTVIYNGIDLDEFTFQPTVAKPQLVFVGRIVADKGIREAIVIARQAQLPLRIAASLHPSEMDYYRSQIEPLIDGSLIQYVGEVDSQTRNHLVQNSIAFLAPLQWQEPFGLTIVESLACGTPVVGSRIGALPELVEHGVTGFLAPPETVIKASVDALHQITTISRQACRQAAEHFSANRMDQAYLALFSRLSE